MHRMGNSVSVEQMLDLNLIPEFNDEDYTVLRTSGNLDAGWKLSCKNYETPWINKSAYRDAQNGKWRIYTQNGKMDPNEFLHAWRDLYKVFPTRLAGKEDEIKEWHEKVSTQLHVLEEARHATVKKVYLESKADIRDI